MFGDGLRYNDRIFLRLLHFEVFLFFIPSGTRKCFISKINQMKKFIFAFAFVLISIVSVTAQEGWKAPYVTWGEQEMKVEEAEYRKFNGLFYFKTDSLHFLLSQGRLKIYQSLYDSIPAYNTPYSILETAEGVLLHAVSKGETITLWLPEPAWTVMVEGVYDSRHYTIVEYTPTDVNWQDKDAWNTSLTTHDAEDELYHTCSFSWEDYQIIWVELFDGTVAYELTFYPHQDPGKSYTHTPTFMPPITLSRN